MYSDPPFETLTTAEAVVVNKVNCALPRRLPLGEIAAVLDGSADHLVALEILMTEVPLAELVSFAERYAAGEATLKSAYTRLLELDRGTVRNGELEAWLAAAA